LPSKALAFFILENPVKSNLKLKLNNVASTTKAVYYLFDITGKKRAGGVLTIPAGSNSLSITLPKTDAGTYLLKLYIDKIPLMQKFIIK
jgi:hypothetical protein